MKEEDKMLLAARIIGICTVEFLKRNTNVYNYDSADILQTNIAALMEKYGANTDTY